MVWFHSNTSNYSGLHTWHCTFSHQDHMDQSDSQWHSLPANLIGPWVIMVAVYLTSNLTVPYAAGLVWRLCPSCRGVISNHVDIATLLTLAFFLWKVCYSSGVWCKLVVMLSWFVSKCDAKEQACLVLKWTPSLLKWGYLSSQQMQAEICTQTTQHVLLPVYSDYYRRCTVDSL